MDYISLLLPLATLLVLQLINHISKHYYVKASEELRHESERLRKLNTLIIQGLEEGHIAKFNRDSGADPMGLTFPALGLTVPFTIDSEIGVEELIDKPKK